MGLAIPDDRTPTSARAIEARWFALPRAIKDKLARLETHKDMLHGACETLRHRVLALRAELSEKTQRLKHDLANASPETRVGVTGSDPWTGGSGSGVATYGGLPGPERQQEIDRLAEQLGRLDVLYRAAQEAVERGLRSDAVVECNRARLGCRERAQQEYGDERARSSASAASQRRTRV